MRLFQRKRSDAAEARRRAEAAALAAFTRCAEAARADVNAFVEFVGRDEANVGAPVVQAACHRRWQSQIAEHRRLVLMAPPSFGKSSQLLLRALWVLGRDPATRILYATGSADRASRWVAAAKRIIETSPELRAVFPDLVRGAGFWRQDGFSVAGRDPGVRHDSIRAVAPGVKVWGDRADWVVAEDCEDQETSGTPAARGKLETWFRGELLSRLSSPAARVTVSGVPQHERGLLLTLARDPAWRTVRDPAETTDGRLLWPERWGRKELDEAKLRFRHLYELLFLLRGDDGSGGRFRRSDLVSCLRAGEGMLLPERWSAGAQCLGLFCGVDPAFLDHDGTDHDRERGDESAIVVVAAVQNPKPYGQPLRRLVMARRGRWSHEELGRRVVDVWHRHRARIFLETNGGGAFLRTICRSMAPDILIRGHVTSRFNKHDRVLGVEGLVSMAEHGEIVLPSRASPEPDGEPTPLGDSADLVDAMLAYAPGEHMPDLLSAFWIASHAISTAGAQGVGWLSQDDLLRHFGQAGLGLLRR